MTAGVMPDLVDQVIVGNCIKKYEQFSEHTALSAKWVSQGIKMAKQHDIRSILWLVFVSIIMDHCNKNLCHADHDLSTTNTPEKRRKIETVDVAWCPDGLSNLDFWNGHTALHHPSSPALNSNVDSWPAIAGSYSLPHVSSTDTRPPADWDDGQTT